MAFGVSQKNLRSVSVYIITLLSVYSPWFPNAIIFEIKKRSRDSIGSLVHKTIGPILSCIL